MIIFLFDILNPFVLEVSQLLFAIGNNFYGIPHFYNSAADKKGKKKSF